MDPKKTGAFIAALRRGKNMTQEDLAGAIGVTDKAVSRWETGRGFPDISLLSALAAALGVTVNELLAGEPIAPGDRDKEDGAVLDALKYMRGMGRKSVSALLVAAGVILLPIVLFCIGVRGPLQWSLAACGVVLIAAGIALPRLPHFSLRNGGPSPGTARGCSICAAVLALGLEISPWSAVLNFGHPGEQGGVEYIRQTFSSFSLTPVGYANFAPMLTGLLTIVLLVLAIIGIRREAARGKGFVCGVLAAVSSLMPLVFSGPRSFGIAPACITICLLAFLVLQSFANR